MEALVAIKLASSMMQVREEATKDLQGSESEEEVRPWGWSVRG